MDKEKLFDIGVDPLAFDRKFKKHMTKNDPMGLMFIYHYIFENSAFNKKPLFVLLQYQRILFLWIYSIDKKVEALTPDDIDKFLELVKDSRVTQHVFYTILHGIISYIIKLIIYLSDLRSSSI